MILHHVDVNLAQAHVLRLVRLQARALGVRPPQRVLLGLELVEELLACTQQMSVGVHHVPS